MIRYQCSKGDHSCLGQTSPFFFFFFFLFSFFQTDDRIPDGIPDSNSRTPPKL